MLTQGDEFPPPGDENLPVVMGAAGKIPAGNTNLFQRLLSWMQSGSVDFGAQYSIHSYGRSSPAALPASPCSPASSPCLMANRIHGVFCLVLRFVLQWDGIGHFKEIPWEVLLLLPMALLGGHPQLTHCCLGVQELPVPSYAPQSTLNSLS